MAHSLLYGKIIAIQPTKVVGNYGLRTRQFILQQYPVTPASQTWPVDLQHEDCDQLDDFKHGDYIVCDVLIRGTVYKKAGATNYFVSLKCFNLNRTTEEAIKAALNPVKETPAPPADNLPF